MKSSAQKKKETARPKKKHLKVVAAKTENEETKQISMPWDLPLAGWQYQMDAWQRNILFWDTLRERTVYVEQREQDDMSSLLDFEHEILLDGRDFDPPANYQLLRVKAVGDDCLEDCLNENKAPVIVIDPRAGHGPGLGGMKKDSEIGVAMHEGHPVYFVSFTPEPCPGQSMADVLHTLRKFVDEVQGRHSGRVPILYGNCQAGWMIMLLAADCKGLAGPVVLNGSPVSYWAGEEGVNPMRVAGGLVGGTWMTHFMGDIGSGVLDGAGLVGFFEALDPGRSWWEKYGNLFCHVDKEHDRFLQFEKWWTGYHHFSREEMVQAVESLFMGNKLERGEIQLCEDCQIDLKNINNPVVVFTSEGDNMTPPDKALGWVSAVYPTTNDLKKAGQRIVYLQNPHIGHLAIFLSGKVVRLEHRAMLESMEKISLLKPGLYEMKIDNPTGDPDCSHNQYSVSFDERKVEDIKTSYPEEQFENARTVSEINEGFYRLFVSPLVRQMVSPPVAEAVRQMHPLRLTKNAFSARHNPWMWGLPVLAETTKNNRLAANESNPFVQGERMVYEQIGTLFDISKTWRDSFLENSFAAMYSWPKLPGKKRK